MSLNPETITQIQTMLQADPTLLAQLQGETELAGVAAVIAKAAAAQGLNVSEPDLMRHLAVEQSQATASGMSDAELEQVAGGGPSRSRISTIGMVVVGCVAYSLKMGLNKRGQCGAHI